MKLLRTVALLTMLSLTAAACSDPGIGDHGAGETTPATAVALFDDLGSLHHAIKGQPLTAAGL